jgi:hypothetical protein
VLKAKGEADVGSDVGDAVGGEVAAPAIPAGRLARPAALEADMSKLRREIVICFSPV